MTAKTIWALTLILASAAAQKKAPFADVYNALSPENLLIDTLEDHSEKGIFCIFTGSCTTRRTTTRRTTTLHTTTTPQPPKNRLTELYAISSLEFDFPNEEARQEAIDSGQFTPGKIIPMDTEIHYSGNPYEDPITFITVPRFTAGVPATLGTFTSKRYHGQPVIAPFPSWRWHQNASACSVDRIVSVFRIKIDECERLWVLDSGFVSGLLACPPQILAFDLATKKLLHRYQIPSSMVAANSTLVTILADVQDPRDGCKKTFIYAADSTEFTLIVYDVENGKSWKIHDASMDADRKWTAFYLEGQTFEYQDGILGMSLSPFDKNVARKLFYQPLAGVTESWVYTGYIKNESLFANPSFGASQYFYTYPGQRISQSAAMAIDRDGISYFGLTTPVTLNCWNTAVEYNNKNIGLLQKNEKTLQFLSSVKIVNDLQAEQELIIMSNRLQKFSTGTLDPSEINFRIMKAKIRHLTLGSKCRRT